MKKLFLLFAALLTATVMNLSAATAETTPEVTDITIEGGKVPGETLTFTAATENFTSEPTVTYSVQFGDNSYEKLSGNSYVPACSGAYTVKAKAIYNTEVAEKEVAFSVSAYLKKDTVIYQIDSLVSLDANGALSAAYKYENSYDEKGNIVQRIQNAKYSAKSPFTPSSKESYIHNEAGNVTEYNTYFWSSSKWNFLQHSVYSYDTQNRRVLAMDSTEGQYTKTEFTYDEQGRPHTEVTCVKNGENWNKFTKRVHSYKDNTDTLILYGWSEKESDWVYNYKSDITSNEQGKQMGYITYQWDSQWKEFQKVAYSYDAHGNKAADTVFSGSSDKWVISSISVYHYSPICGPLDYLHFVGLNGNDTVRLNKVLLSGTALPADLAATFQYSNDRKTWKSYDTWTVKSTSLAEGTAIALNAGDTVFFRALGTDGKNAMVSQSNSDHFQFVFGADDSIAAGGNIMSLYDATCEQDTMTVCGFYCLFENAKQLVSAPKLPAKKLAHDCYGGMFQRCYALTTAPTLSATILAELCYAKMFRLCSNLEVNTYSGSCSGAELVVPDTATAPKDWNKNMFSSCKGNAVGNIQLGGHYCMKEYVDTLDYLHFVGLNGNDTVRLNKYANFAMDLPSLTATFEYSKDRKTWTEYTWDAHVAEEQKAPGAAIALNAGDTVFFRAKGVNGKNATMSYSNSLYFLFKFGVDDSIAAGGNIMSLYDAECKQDSMTDYGFTCLFFKDKQLVSTPKLPATKLAKYCYYQIFSNCSGITKAPELPATTLEPCCYQSMFSTCTALTQAPELKATTLALKCYINMFNKCSKLEVDTFSLSCDGAELVVPDTTAAPDKWNSGMFDGCKGDYTNVVLGGHYCIKEWVDKTDYLHFVGLNGNDTVRLNKVDQMGMYLAQLTATFEYSKDRKTWTAYDTWGTYGDPVAKTALGAAIALNQGDTVFFRAKGINGKNATLNSGQAYFSFAFGADDSIAAGGNVMSLYDATCKQDTMTKSGFLALFENAKQLVSAPALPATKLAESCYSRMFKGCTSLTSAPALSVTTLENSCYISMFKNCTSLTTAPELKATTLAIMCYSYMFEGCTYLTKAPELKATTLADWCYGGMFKNCTSLEVDTCTGSCDGAKLEVPNVSGTAPTNWNKDMFQGCKGTYANNIQLGGHYCIKEYIEKKDTIKGVTIVDYTGVYDGQKHTVTVNGTIDSDKIAYSTDSATWSAEPVVKNAGETLLYVRVQRAKHYDWYGKGKATIAAKPLTITAPTITDKEYDGHERITPTAGTLSGVIQGDDVNVLAAGLFADKNVGQGKQVVVDYVLYGAAKDNYLAPTNDTLTASITAKKLTVESTIVNDKAYDGTTDADVVAGTLQGVIGTDDVSIASATGAFADKDAEDDKNVSVVYTLKGEDAGNYEVSDGEMQATIEQRELTLESANLEKMYDGTPMTGEGSNVIATSYVDGECFTYYFVGSQTAVGESDNSFDYSDSETAKVSNYQVTAIFGKLTVTTTDVAVTITANSDSKIFDNTPLTNNGYTHSNTLCIGDYFADVVVDGTQTKVGQSANQVTSYVVKNQQGDNVTAFYTNIQKENGILTIINPIVPQIEGMYDQWNIVLDRAGLTDTLETYINGVVLLADNVTWYVVKGDADQVNQVTGAISDDVQATPATGFYHTEGKAMNDAYYCVVKVPEAENIFGVSYFQSNVVFVATPAPTAPMRKMIKDGQLIIIRDGAKFNAQGARL